MTEPKREPFSLIVSSEEIPLSKHSSDATQVKPASEKKVIRKRLNFWETGMQKYKLVLEGEMQLNSMHTRNKVEDSIIFQVKDISENGVVLDYISYAKEMTDCTNEGFKEMFAVTRQFEKLYDELSLFVAYEGKVEAVKNIEQLKEKWLRIKKETVRYFNEPTDIESFFNLNDQTMNDASFWIKMLNEQEFLLLFFTLAGYGNRSFDYSKKLTRDNAFRTNAIEWNLYTEPVDVSTELIRTEVKGNFSPSKDWLVKAYGQMPFFTGVPLQPNFVINASYVFSAKTGFIEQAEIYLEEAVHPGLLFHKMKYKIIKQ